MTTFCDCYRLGCLVKVGAGGWTILYKQNLLFAQCERTYL